MSSIRESQVYFTASTAKASLVLVPLLSFIGIEAQAQVIPTDGGSTTVVNVVSGNTPSMEERIDITGGRLSGDNSNLFQSFEQFDISAEQTANFVTTPDVQNVVGKVSGGSASSINGTLQVSGSDASLYLMNPAGVLIGPNAQLNLSGDFTATTATDITFESDQVWSGEDGNYSSLNGEPTGFNFEKMQPGAVVNLGDLSVENGRAINLVGGTVVNDGRLSAPEGTITMAAVEGDRYVRMSRGEQLLSLEVEASQLSRGGVNGAIAPESIGEMITGGNMSSATALVTASDGSVWLGGEAVDESGGSAIASGELSATGEMGGDINVLGDRVGLIEATLDASGTTGGGLIRVGGDYQGKGKVANAAHTSVNAGSSLLADGITQGSGGNVIVWSDDTTDFHGSVSARGGLIDGNGGLAEVSGKASLNFRGRADLGAPAGEFGTLLLDPKRWVITDGSAPVNSADTSYISSTDIESISGNIFLSADDGITIEDLSDNELTLKRDTNIRFEADSDGDGVGSFMMDDLSDAIRTERGDIDITGVGISAGTLSTHTDEHDPGGNGGVAGGAVTLSSSQDVTVGDILTYGWYNGNHHSGDGGDVKIVAAGNVVVERTIQTYSSVDGRESGEGGDISLYADSNIRVGNASVANERVLAAYSRADSYDSGHGGNIELISNNGAIDVIGDISAISATHGTDSQGDGDAGDGGNVFIQAENNINTRNIFTRSRASIGSRAGRGGDIDILSASGNVEAGFLKSNTYARGSQALEGGDVTLRAQTVEVAAIETKSSARAGAGDGGEVNISAVNVSTGFIDTSSVADEDSSNAGSVSLLASERLTVRDIVATSAEDGRSADIVLTSNDLNLGGGERSLNGNYVWLKPASSEIDIAVGGLSISKNLRQTLDILQMDLKAVGTAEGIRIGLADSTGSIAIGSGAINGVRPSLPISILGGQTLIGPDNGDYQFELAGPGQGEILGGNRLVFSNIENLVGGNQDDTFVVGPDAFPGGFDSIAGGGGINTLSYEQILGGFTTDLRTLKVTDIQNIVGNGTSTLQGYDEDNRWTIDGDNRGTLSDISFSGFSNLVGGVEEDTFEFIRDGRLSGGLNGSLGEDSLDYSAYQQAVDVAIGDADVVVPGVSSIADVERIKGSAFADVLRSTVTNSVFKIESNYAGSVDGVSFSGFERVEGRVDSVDRLDYSSYNEAIEIDLEAGRISNSLAFGEIEEIVGSGRSGDVLKGRNADEVFVLNGESREITNGALSFLGVEVIDGGLGGNTLELEGSEGQWVVDGRDSGKVNGFRFENFGSLEGSDRSDTFAIRPDGEISKSVVGRDGSNTLTYAGYDTAVSINLGENSSTAVASFKEIERVIGSRADGDSLIGSDEDDRFEIAGDRAGRVNSDLVFSDIEKLEGGKGDDTFVFDDLIAASGISVSGGETIGESNTVRTNAAGTVWKVTGENTGSLSQSAETLTDFSQIQNIQNTSEGGDHDVIFASSRARITGSIDGGRGNLSLIGDSIEIGEQPNGNGSGSNGRIAGTGKLTVRPNDQTLDIELGGGRNSANTLNINGREIEAIEGEFTEIVFGAEQQAGSIRFLESAEFGAPVTIKTEGSVDIANNRLLTSKGDIEIAARNSVDGGSVVSRLGSVEISSQGDIQIEGVASGGGGKVTVASTDGSVLMRGDVISGTRTVSLPEDIAVGGSVDISAERAIAIGNIVTAGTRRGGDVTLASRTGSIAARGINTSNRLGGQDRIAEASGSVSLMSPGSIEIEFIDARGRGSNTDLTSVRVDTEGDFSAIGSIGIAEDGRPEASISTRGARDGQIYIRYGLENRLANPFTIGNESGNGTAFGIETPQTTLISGGLFSYNEGDGIEIVSNGIVPINTSLEAINKDSNVPDFRLASADSERAATVVFQQVEGRSIQEFGEYLGVGDDARTKAATLSEVQMVLAEVEQETGIQPAMVYAYFVPDAASKEAVGISEPLQEGSPDRTMQPEDQLEVMVITPEGIPTVKRQWGVTRQQVDEVSREFRQKATSQFSAAQEYLDPAQQLYDWIIAPIAETLEQQSTESLGFVMDTGLRTIPVAALHDGERYLVEKYSLGLLPSFSLTDIDATHNKQIDFRESQVLAMGASEFENQPDLPAVNAEVSLISEGAWKGDAFLNEDFVLENIQKQLGAKDYGILHLATHASFEAGDLENSYIQLWNEKLSLDKIGELALEEENLGLIILSACNTALGDQAAEYGFAGLAVSSGSQSALASLWPVSDEGTLGFMTQFYDDLRTAPVKSEALRQAQIRMIRGDVGIADGVVYGPDNEVLTTLPALAESGQWDFSHPFYWSAFTMIGNPW